ncbi:hypothetical protein V8E53_009892, partial [Lactarius tabidus]
MSHDDVATPDSSNAQWRSSTKETDIRVKKGLNPVAENEGAGGHQGKTRQGQPKPRRSKEQIEAEREAKRKALEEKTRITRMAQENLVRMNLREECEDSLRLQHPPHSSTVIQKRYHMDVDTDSDECFDLGEADNHGSDSDPDLDSDAGSKPLKAAEPKAKSRKKRVKGAARQELMTRMEELRHAKHPAKRQKSKDDVGRFTVQDLRCKKYTNSGLRSRSPTPLSVVRSQVDSFELGGLCDDDLEESYPAIVETKGPQKHTSHGNELVKIGAKTDVHMGKPQAKCKVPKSKAVTKAAKATVKNITLYSEEEHKNVKPFARGYSDMAQECLNDPRWTRTFLQTLSHALYVSNHPFTDWTWGSVVLLKTLQGVFDISFPNISYKLTGTQHDHVARAAYDRMKTRKSKIASNVLTLVKTFFDGDEYRNRPEKIREYVRW